MKKFILSTGILAALALPLSAQEQKLEVRSDPPGCVVFLDRQLQGQTPLTLSGLKPGVHLLRVSKSEKYHPYQENLVVELGQDFQRQVTLRPLSATSLEEGVKALENGQMTLAKGHLERALVAPPVQVRASWWLGKIALEEEQFDLAFLHFKNYAQVYPTEPEVHLYLADLHARFGRLGPAVTSYKLALLNTKDLKRALEQVPPATWESIKALGDPTSPEEQMKLAYLHELKGQFPEALVWLKRATAVVFSNWPETNLSVRPSQDRSRKS